MCRVSRQLNKLYLSLKADGMRLGLKKMENISVMSYMHLGSVNIIVLGYSNKKVHLINLKQIKCYCATIKKGKIM